MLEELVLKIGGRSLSGWLATRVTRGIEHCPSDFEVSMTERYPGEAKDFIAQTFDPCEVRLGPDLVLTGYVDRVNYSISAGQHSITVIGRSKCADLVDCSAEWPGGQISGADALGIATRLADPYGIKVTAPGSKGVRVQQFNLMYGETAFEIIDRVCRYGALLAYDQPDGNLILTQAAKVRATGGIIEGVNMQSATMSYTGDQRFDQYYCWSQSMDVLTDLGEGGNLMAATEDLEVPRHRARYIISEAPSGGQDFAQQRVNWECNRRIGYGARLDVVVDSWRDSAGDLWTPNTLVFLQIPSLKVGDNWRPADSASCDGPQGLISSVTYRRDENGTTAQLTIMRPEAFLPIPAIQLRTNADLPERPGFRSGNGPS